MFFIFFFPASSVPVSFKLRGMIAECSLFSAKIVQTSAMQVHLHIAECSLFSAKIGIFIYIKHSNHEKAC